MSSASSENPTSELSCRLCRTSHSSEWELKEHLWSLLHHVKLEQKYKDSRHECALCQTVCNDLLQYGRHLNEMQHKQALEKAKEKKKGKPKTSHPRNVSQRVAGKGKLKRSLMPNPNWHLNPVNQHSLRVGAKLQPQFGNCNPASDWHRNGQKEFPSFGMHPPFPKNHYWNNGNYSDNKSNFHSFYKNDRNSYDRWKNSGYVPYDDNRLPESNRMYLSSKNKIVNQTEPLIMNKYLVYANLQKLKKDPPPPPSKVPTDKVTDSTEHSRRPSPESSSSMAKNPSKTAENPKSVAKKPLSSKTSFQIKKNPVPLQPKRVSTSDQVCKAKTSVAKLKAKKVLVKAVISPKRKTSQTTLSSINKNGKTNPSRKSNAEIAEPVSKKYIVAASVNKTPSNCNVPSVNKNTPSPSQLRVPFSLKNGKSVETEKISATVVNKTTVSNPLSLTEKNSAGKPNDSDTKISRDTSSLEGDTTLTKRNITSTDTPDISPVPNKKQKTLLSAKCGSLEPRKKIVESESSNSLTVANKKQKTTLSSSKCGAPETGNKIVESESLNSSTVTNSESQEKDSFENKTPRQNNDSEKKKPSRISVDCTEEPKSLSAVLPSGETENCFKVNNELVKKLHKKLIGENPIKSFRARVKSPEHQPPSKDEANPSGKSNSGNVRQEELVKMMKLPRLNRKEKMHLSSLLQSYTKSQNKKLAVPRLTMQLSGVYDDGVGGGSSSSSVDPISTDTISNLELPAGMEEQIAHLIKRENLEAMSPFEATDDSNLGISAAQLLESQLQDSRNESSSVSVRQKRNVKRKTIPEKSKVVESSTLQSPKTEISDDNNNDNNNDDGGTDFASNAVSTFVAPSSAQPVVDQQESTIGNPVVSDSQLNNNTSSSTNLPDSSERLPQANISALETTGTKSDSTENPLPSSNENIFNKVYQLTLREEQIRSSIVDMNEKMNYLRKLIEDSQMALQGCCVEHKRLLDEESSIRDQRLQILQNAMSNRNLGNDSANNLQFPQPNQASEPVSLARPDHQTGPGFPQMDTNHQTSSLPQPQIGYSHLGSGSASVNRNSNQIQESLLHPHSSNIPSNTTSTFQPPLNQPQLQPEAPPSDRPLTIQPVNRNPSSKQNLLNCTAPPNPNLNQASPRLGNDIASTDNFIGLNIDANVTSDQDPSMSVTPIIIKQELLSPSSPPLSSGMATSPTEKKGLSPGSQLQPSDNKRGAVSSVLIESRDTKQESSDLRDKNVCENTTKLLPNDFNNSANQGDQLLPIDKTVEAEPELVIDFKTIQIKKEPVTPPPQVENEETFFVPQLITPENRDKNNVLLSEKNQIEPQTTGTEKTVTPTVSASSANNLLGSASRNENLEKSRGMSMTYLGSMPNNFLERLTLSWKKQNSSATEASARSSEHSFSDSESTSSRNVSSFVQKLGPQFSIPDEMNPRVCLEPLNMKFHRKRTLSEPLSNGGCVSSLKANNELKEQFQADPKSKSEGDGSSDVSKTDSVKLTMFEEPTVKRKAVRCGTRVKITRAKGADNPTTCDDNLHSSDKARLPDDKSNDANFVSSDRENMKSARMYSFLSDDSSRDSDAQQPNDPVRISDDLNKAGTPSCELSPRERNYDPQFPANPMNIFNNLSMVHAVRTKKFPRVHVNGSEQLPTFKSVKSPVNGLYVFEENLYASYQGSSPCKFSVDTGACLQVYNCTPYSVQCMLVYRVNKTKVHLFSGGASELLLIFDEATGKLCSKIDTCRKVYSLHENWGHLFIGLADGGVTKVNLKSLKKTSELSYGSKPINCLATCTEAAQKLLCVGAYDASILIVDAMTGLLLKTLHCYHRLLYAIKVHQNLIFSCSSDKTLQVHDITTGKLLRCLQDHTSTISCLHVDDNLLATGSHDKQLNIYNSSNPTEAPVIFFTPSKEPISCLAIHKNLAYCGNFFGHIDTIRFDTGQKWLCKYDACRLTFGQRKGLFYHLVNFHLQMTCLDRIKCQWEDCGEYICSVLDITEHCENHLNKM